MILINFDLFYQFILVCFIPGLKESREEFGDKKHRKNGTLSKYFLKNSVLDQGYISFNSKEGEEGNMFRKQD